MALDGKVAIVTGASRGIGESIARYLAKHGATVVLAARSVDQAPDPRLPGTIKEVAASIEEAGGKALPIRTDVRDPESIKACVQETVDRLGRLDIVVNNAVVLVPGTIETVQERHIDLMYQIGMRGPLLLARYAIPHMKEVGGGDIINISSGVAISPGPGPYADPQSGNLFYGMIKAGLERATQSLAQELQDYNIKANVLSLDYVIHTPGFNFAGNDPEHPDLNFESADWMGRSAVWICEQPPSYTGHIVFDREIRDQIADL